MARRAESRPRTTPLAGTDPGGAGLAARERLERYGVNTLSDAGAADDPRRFQRGLTADAVPDEFGPVQALPRESAGDLVRIAGVTPGDRPAVITAAVSAGTPRTTPPSRPS